MASAPATPAALLSRLDAIGQSLANDADALALLGLGSVGVELDRLDAFSDLDFFVVVREGCQARFIADLSWLSNVCPIAYRFRNTADGYKALFEDGIFAEFAVFAPSELARIPFAPGRIVWKRPEVDDGLGHPAASTATAEVRSIEWLLGEALTNLYVGLGRHQRGEVLSAARFIQGYAVDRIVELASHIEPARPAHADPFTAERRFEARYPNLAQHLPDFVQGYSRNRESARAILDFLQRHFGASVDSHIEARIRERL